MGFTAMITYWGMQSTVNVKIFRGFHKKNYSIKDDICLPKLKSKKATYFVQK